MRLITACALTGNMDSNEIWTFWVNSRYSEHLEGCAMRWGYPTECKCKAPSGWFFPYDVVYTYACLMKGVKTLPTPINDDILDW